MASPRPTRLSSYRFHCSTFLLTVLLRVVAAASIEGTAAKVGRVSPAFLNPAAEMADENRAFLNDTGRPGNYGADGSHHLRAAFVDQYLPAGNASENAILNSTGNMLLRRKRTHHHHHVLHHHHSATGAAGGDMAHQFDNVLFRAVGLIDSNTCLSKFVCEVVARRGAHSFIGTTIGSFFKGLAHAPPSSPAHALWRAVAIGKHGWLPVCHNAFPHCSSKFSTVLSILNVIWPRNCPPDENDGWLS
ncbi:hypothetical protein HPB50_004137 [Hyalomma asiaticum]|uniref:Uncharacterized protein n=1 Tax=Hyalomma asiaticum TaxID=266040 RepID=A0ACB7SEE0_HYAAI|nr:hypothetical protein HPB50_004137 [Hyalomma asiaticum]